MTTPLLRRLAVLALVLGAALAAPSPSRAENPWTVLGELRKNLQNAGPRTATFVQTYIPAGFSSGDQERGHISLWIPSCLRWNYSEPEGKNFLVCDGEVYFWQTDEPGGRHYEVRAAEEPGLDLLLLDLDVLRERYRASSEKEDDGSWRVDLALPTGASGTFDATLRVDAGWKEVRSLEYTDDDGNRTRFEMGDYKRLDHIALFQPPRDIEWTKE